MECLPRRCAFRGVADRTRHRQLTLAPRRARPCGWALGQVLCSRLTRSGVVATERSRAAPNIHPVRRWYLLTLSAASLGCLAGWALSLVNPSTCTYTCPAESAAHPVPCPAPPCPASSLSVAAGVVVGVAIAFGIVLLGAMLLRR